MNTPFISSYTKACSLFLVLLGTGAFLPAQSQKNKGPLQLADEYYAAGEFYTAAHLYGQYLHPIKKPKEVSDFPLNSRRNRSTSYSPAVLRTDVIYKQAESYRQANYWSEAAAAYKECTDKDVKRHADALYWLGVSHRSLGHYDSSEYYLKNFLASADGNAAFKTAAEKELRTLQFIKKQLTRADSVLVKMKKIEVSNSAEKGAFAPVHIGGDRFLFSSTQLDTPVASGVNPYRSHIYSAVLNNDVLTNIDEVELSTPGSVGNQGAAAVSPDGRYLYFSQWSKQNGRTVSSIYYATRQQNGWSSPALLSSVQVNGFSSKQPFCTKDGKYLYFSSDRSGGAGGFDIWYAPLRADGTTGSPVNAGTMINTAGDEQTPFYQSSSTTLVFSSNGREGMGGFDLFAAQGQESSWKSVENLGHPVNSSRDDLYFSAKENEALLAHAVFSSDRGEGCCLETYAISKAPKSRQLSGTIQDCADQSGLANTTVTLKDASGKSWTVSTDDKGRYTIDLGSLKLENPSITLTREKYLDTTMTLQVENTDESDLLVDKLTGSTGCMVEKLVIKAEDVVTVYFDYDKFNLKPAAVEKLDSIYNILSETPAATLQISGYTDGRGSVEYNAILSDKRARACAEYLVQKGVDANRITFVSFGACCPVEMELINGRDNPDGRSRNRRALINVKKD